MTEYAKADIEQAVKHCEDKRQYMDCKFKKYRKMWEDKRDDRMLFCNIFDKLREAVDAMESVHNNTIWVAFNRLYHEDMDRMDDIVYRFTKGPCKDAE